MSAAGRIIGMIGQQGTYRVNKDNLVGFKGIKAANGQSLRVQEPIARFLIKTGIARASKGYLELTEFFNNKRFINIFQNAAASEMLFYRSERSILETNEIKDFIGNLIHALKNSDWIIKGKNGAELCLFPNLDKLQEGIEQLDKKLWNNLQYRVQDLNYNITKQICAFSDSYRLADIAKASSAAFVLVSKPTITTYDKSRIWKELHLEKIQEIMTLDKLSIEQLRDVHEWVLKLPGALKIRIVKTYGEESWIKNFGPLTLAEKVPDDELVIDKSLKIWANQIAEQLRLYGPKKQATIRSICQNARKALTEIKSDLTQNLLSKKNMESFKSQLKLLNMLNQNEFIDELKQELVAICSDTIIRLKTEMIATIRDLAKQGKSEKQIQNEIENSKQFSQINTLNQIIGANGGTQLIAVEYKDQIHQCVAMQSQKELGIQIKTLQEKQTELLADMAAFIAGKNGLIKGLELLKAVKKFKSEVSNYMSKLTLNKSIANTGVQEAERQLEVLLQAVEANILSESFASRIQKAVTTATESATRTINESLEQAIQQESVSLSIEDIKKKPDLIAFQTAMELKENYQSMIPKPEIEGSKTAEILIEELAYKWISQKVDQITPLVEGITALQDHLETENDISKFSTLLAEYAGKLSILAMLGQQYPKLSVLVEQLQLSEFISLEEPEKVSEQVSKLLGLLAQHEVPKIKDRVQIFQVAAMDEAKKIIQTKEGAVDLSKLPIVKKINALIVAANEYFKALGTGESIVFSAEKELTGQVRLAKSFKRIEEKVAAKQKRKEFIRDMLFSATKKEDLTKALSEFSENLNDRELLREIFMSDGCIVHAAKDDPQTNLLYRCLTINHLFTREDLKNTDLLINGKAVQYDPKSQQICYTNGRRVSIMTGTRVAQVDVKDLEKENAHTLWATIDELNQQSNQVGARKEMEKIIDQLKESKQGRKLLRQIFLTSTPEYLEVRRLTGHLHKYITIKHLFSQNEFEQLGEKTTIRHRGRSHLINPKSDREYQKGQRIYIANNTRIEVNNRDLLAKIRREDFGIG